MFTWWEISLSFDVSVLYVYVPIIKPPPPTSSVSAPSPDSVFGAQSGSSSQQSADAAVTGSSQ